LKGFVERFVERSFCMYLNGTFRRRLFKWFNKYILSQG